MIYRQRFKKLILLVGLCGLFAGCSTERYAGMSAPRGLMADTSARAMGVRYLLGRGVPQSDAKAFSYLYEAAVGGDAFAENELAYLYASGRGTPQNYPKALIWYQKAADHGLASAEYNVGFFYWYGLGTPVNKTLGMTWFKKAKAHGFEPANAFVGQ